ncbi:MAG: capsule assembly Wzi family protein [Muribaculaceae bacterium]|nr:capsule assembly Wzi family protein [Muribaculaceae bacterium]
MKPRLLSLLLGASCATAVIGAPPVDLKYSASIVANVSTGEQAPYMIGSWNYGRVTGASGIWHDGYIAKEMTLDRRFNWGAGVEYLVGYGSSASYRRYDAATSTWGESTNRQAPARLHQAYAEIKYRGVYLLAGMKERRSDIVDGSLSSGDITRSNNARPIPGVAAGFVDFQNIPFTKGWVQIDGEIMYGRFFDDDYRRKTFNYYSGLLSVDNWYTYKRCYFRTMPSQPFCVTVGMQAAGEFAGYARLYSKGKVVSEENRGFHIRDLWDMFFPTEGNGESYYKGNSLGSWDFKARYRLRTGAELTAYFEWPWEDGSGIGRANGWDGLWGVQYTAARRGGLLNKAVIEYFDFTNQSGPIHWSATDAPGTTLDGVTGGDNYYNNDFYGPYSNYGMSIGSPFVVSPLYNSNGMPGYLHNRARGFHAAAEGCLSPTVDYKLMVSWQQAGGTGRVPDRRRVEDTSAKAAIDWRITPKVPGLRLHAEVAFDAGKLRGNNFGALAGISYSGILPVRKK